MRKGSTKYKLCVGLEKAIQMYGGAHGLARALGCHPQAIGYAKRKGSLGFKHAYKLYKLTKGKIPMDESMGLGKFQEVKE